MKIEYLLGLYLETVEKAWDYLEDLNDEIAEIVTELDPDTEFPLVLDDEFDDRAGEYDMDISDMTNYIIRVIFDIVCYLFNDCYSERLGIHLKYYVNGYDSYISIVDIHGNSKTYDGKGSLRDFLQQKTACGLDSEREIIEPCSECGEEIHMLWNVELDGYKAYCPRCGKRLMLCDECQHRNGYLCNDCDYDSSTDTCRFNKKKENFYG